MSAQERHEGLEYIHDTLFVKWLQNESEEGYKKL